MLIKVCCESRAQFQLQPTLRKDSLGRTLKISWAAGLYAQPPFYREMRNLQGTVNTNLLAQSQSLPYGDWTIDSKPGMIEPLPLQQKPTTSTCGILCPMSLIMFDSVFRGKQGTRVYGWGDLISRPIGGRLGKLGYVGLYARSRGYRWRQPYVY